MFTATPTRAMIAVEQDLDQRFAPVKRVDQLVLAYPSHRYAQQTLLMPKFSQKAISDRQLDSIIAYLQQSKTPDDIGGWGVGHVGPVPEGMVAWLIAFVLVGMCAVLGARLRT